MLTAFSADLSKISSPLLETTSASITVPSDINLTRIVHFKPAVTEAGRIQLRSTFFRMASFACAASAPSAAALAFAASTLACAAASAFAFSAASALALAAASASALACAAASALALAALRLSPV